MKSKSSLILFLISAISSILFKLYLYCFSPLLDIYEGGLVTASTLLFILTVVSLIATVTGFMVIKPLYNKLFTAKNLLYIVLFLINLYIVITSLFGLIGLQIIM